MTLHVCTRPHQPAPRFVTELGAIDGEPLKRHWTRYPGNRLLPTSCCQRMRPAKNLTVQVYYDSASFWCRPGKGCKRPRHRRRVTRRRLLREFMGGLSMVGLARKYGHTSAEIQARLRCPEQRRRVRVAAPRAHAPRVATSRALRTRSRRDAARSGTG